MSTNLIRMRNAAVANRIETTPGVDAIGVPAGTDWGIGDVEIQFDQNTIPNPELTGSLDRGVGIPGGIRSTVRIRTPLRGGGAALTAPWWDGLMLACAMVEDFAGSGSGFAVSGTTTSITMGGAPFDTTPQSLRGLPIQLSGDQTALTGVIDYSGAGRIMQLGSTLAQSPTASTLVSIFDCWRYSPTSSESVYKTATIYFFADGMLWRFVGAMGSWSLELTTGGIGFLTFVMRADLVSAPTVSALPSNALAVARPTPPRFVAGKMQLNRLAAQTRTLTMNAGVNILLPDDPEATEGVGAALPTERLVSGNLDPYMATTRSPGRFAAFQAGTQVPLIAMLGSAVGNRFLLTLPTIRKVQLNPTNRDGMGVDAIAFEADGANSAVFLTQF